MIRKAFRLNPQPESWLYNDLGMALLINERFEEAVEALRKCVDRLPGWTLPRTFLINAYIAVGDKEDAKEQAKDLLKLDSDFSIDEFVKTWPTMDPAWPEHWRERLTQAGLN